MLTLFRPMRFFTCSECGGANNPVPSAYDSTKSSKYPALASSNELKLLGVAAAGEQQAFLTGSILPGFVWLNEDGVAVVETEPELSLPAATSGAFTKVLVGTADTPSKWQMLPAPASGSYALSVVGGVFVLTAFSSVPLDTLGAAGATNSPLVLVGIRNTGGSTWVTEKLAVANERVLVGSADGLSVKSLPTNEFLLHTLANFTTLLVGSYAQLDGAGAAIAGGIAAGVNDSTNNVLAIYNISSKKFFRAPARVAYSSDHGDQVAITDNGTWQSMGSHGEFPSQTVNYPNLFFAAVIRSSVVNNNEEPKPPDNYNMDFGLFVDGVLAFTWLVKGAKDNSLTYLLTGVSLGSHEFEIKVKKSTVTLQAFFIDASNISVFSVV